MIGTRFHRLLVIEELEPLRYTRTLVRRYRCLCDCGAEVIAQRPNLRRGATKSCGCWKTETAGLGTKKHGRSKTTEYEIWAGIKKRCTNHKSIGWPIYGGRGIKMSAAWASDFSSFLADMGQRPSPKHSIDRIDVNGDYSKENCRWATSIEQGHNTRIARHVIYKGREFTIRQFAKHLGHSYWSIYAWIAREGMSAEMAAQKAATLSRRLAP